jgi:hypothetical protein
MYTIFNELSFYPKIENTLDNNEARNIIDGWLDILKKLKKSRTFHSIAVSEDVYAFQVSADYNIYNWLSDPSVRKEDKMFYKTFQNQRYVNINSDDYVLSSFEIGLGDRTYEGLGCLVAYEVNELLLSLKTQDLWESDIIKGNYSTLDPETESIYVDEEKTIRNISSISHFENVEISLLSDTAEIISSGQDLWEKREYLFPNLIFCESVKDQLYKYPQKFHIDQIIKKLQGLQRYFSECSEVYDPKKLGLDARSESETVKTDKHLKSMRLFTKPDGTNDYFFDHIGFSGCFCGRIHFFPDTRNKACFIGYIGPHLKTAKY